MFPISNVQIFCGSIALGKSFIYNVYFSCNSFDTWYHYFESNLYLVLLIKLLIKNILALICNLLNM